MARRSGGVRISFDHLGFCNVHRNQSARAFLHLAPIAATLQGLNPRVEQRNAIATKLSGRVVLVPVHGIISSRRHTCAQVYPCCRDNKNSFPFRSTRDHGTIIVAYIDMISLTEE